jgi:hypothetical protein
MGPGWKVLKVSNPRNLKGRDEKGNLGLLGNCLVPKSSRKQNFSFSPLDRPINTLADEFTFLLCFTR